MRFARGMIKEIQIHSNELGEHMELMVYLPPTFTPLKKYTVLIAQDGRDYFQLGRIGRIADELIHTIKIEDIIIVGIPYKSVVDRRRKYHPQGDQQKKYIRFLAHELVPSIDSEFPTFQMGLSRALLGSSLGATVSILAALQYPHTFGKLILQSPFVNDDVLQKVNHFEQQYLLDIYHVVGTEETEVKTTIKTLEDFLSPNRELAKLFQKKFPTYFYDEFHGDHKWTFWQPDLKRALQRMFTINTN